MHLILLLIYLLLSVVFGQDEPQITFSETILLLLHLYTSLSSCPAIIHVGITDTRKLLVRVHSFNMKLVDSNWRSLKIDLRIYWTIEKEVLGEGCLGKIRNDAHLTALLFKWPRQEWKEAVHWSHKWGLFPQNLPVAWTWTGGVISEGWIPCPAVRLLRGGTCKCSAYLLVMQIVWTVDNYFYVLYYILGDKRMKYHLS